MKSSSINFCIAVALSSTACSPSESDFKVFSAYESPDGVHLVEIDSARSKLAFGPETIQVHVTETSKGLRRHIVTTKIANDGAGISDSNVKATWLQPEVIQFCLSGVEQDDRVLEINVQSTAYTERTEGCG